MQLIRFIKGRRYRSALAFILVATLVSRAWAGLAKLPAVISLIPSEAPIAVVIPSLSGLSNAIAKLNQEALDSSVPEMADVLGTFKMFAGITRGLNDNGAFLLVVTQAEGLEEAMNSEEPPLVILLPVSDYAAYVTSFGGNPNEPITQLNLPGNSPGFAKSMGGYVVIGPTKEGVESFHPGQDDNHWAKAVGKIGVRCLSSSEAAVIINVQAMEPVFRPKIQTGLDQIKKEILRDLPNQEPAGIAAVQAMVSVYGDTANALLRDTSALVVGLDFSDQGVGLSYSAQFKPNSYLARVFTNGGGAAGQLARVSKQPYLIASSIDFRGMAIQTLMADLMGRVKQVVDQVPAEQKDPMVGPIVEFFDHLTPLMGQIKGTTTLYSPPAQAMMMAGGGLKGVMVYETQNGEAYKGHIQNYMESLEKLIGLVNQPPQGAASQPGQPNAPQAPVGPKITMDYTPGALNVDGIEVDAYSMQIQLPPEMMQQMGPMMPLFAMMGGTGTSGYVAAKGPFVVMTTTPDAQLVKETLANIGKPNGLGQGDLIAQTRRAGLGPDPSFEFYLSVPGLMDTVNLFIAMMGQPPIQVPADLAPVAMGGSVIDHGMNFQLYVPKDLIRFCYTTANQMMGNNQGGPGPQDQDPNNTPQDSPRRGPPPAPF